MPLSHRDYTVACICPMGVELAPVEAMLDQAHPRLPTQRDHNNYTLGEIGGHNIVIAVLPEIGNSAATTVAIQLLNDFPSIRFGLLVGTGGGVPDEEDGGDDIRLGDVVVSKSTDTFGGVVQYDMGKQTADGFKRTGTLNKPPAILRSTVQMLLARHERERSCIPQYLADMVDKFPNMKDKYTLPAKAQDQLFKSAYNHAGGHTCNGCDVAKIVQRPDRAFSSPLVHYGTIGSANRLLKDGSERDRLKRDMEILCVEMEAAGLMDSFPCLVIRGICDYADSHKNKKWQPYAAATAAAYMKELLSTIPAQKMTKIPNASFQTAKHDEATIKGLNDLQVTDPAHDMERIEDSKDPLLKDCYEWILQDPILQEWRDGDTNSLLWINGDPGKGKTMLMIALVRELLYNRPRKSTAVTFFFCQSTDPRLNNAVSILRGLIWKLAMDNPQLAKLFYEKYESDKHLLNGPNSVHALFSTLSAMLEDCPGTFLFIDALDECHPGPERDQLLNLITKHAKYSSKSKAKWLLASRNTPDIKQVLKPESRLLSLELNELHISKAVRVFIEQKTRELAVKREYSLDLTEKVKKELITKADSTFLWVALACKRLLKVTRWKTLSTLANLPPGLEDLYTRMIEQVLQCEDEEDRNFCFQILRSVSLAFRPLSIEELITMAQLPTELLENNNLFELIDLCGSFITAREGILYFVHQSAKDYLTTAGAQKLFSAGIQEEHGLVVSRFLGAMSSVLRRDMCNLKHPGSPARMASIDTRVKAIGYASCFWVDHLAYYLRDRSIDSLHYRKYLLDQGRVHQFLLKHLLHWFESLGLTGEVDRGIMALHSLERMIGKTPTKSLSEIALNHKNFVHDAIRVFRQCRPAIDEAPLQVYCSTLVFSPENSLVGKNFRQEAHRWISTLPRIPKDWSPCLQTLEGHMGSVRLVAFSPNGQQLASASNDGTVRLWDAATGACRQTLEGTLEGHTGSVCSVAFSPDGQQLASASNDGTVRLWDAATGTCTQTLEGHTDSVYSVAFSPDGPQLASASDDRTVRLWDAATGACLQTLEGHTRYARSVAFSPDGPQLASASDDHTVRLWDAATGACLQTLEGYTDSVYSVAFSPDGQRLASASDEFTVRLWDTATGACLQTLEGHTRYVRSVAFSPDGQQLASASSDDTVRLWDAATGTCLQTLEDHTDTVYSVAFSPDGQQLASASHDHTVRLWDAATGACLQTLEGHTRSVYSVAFSPGGPQLASASDDRTVRLWDAATGACLQTLEGYTDSVVFSPVGPNLITYFWVLGSKQTLQSYPAPKRVECGIESENKWITWNGSKILWLPPEYRPIKSAVKKNRIGIGCESGVVYILNFNQDILPP